MWSPSNALLADKLREMADILAVQHEDGYRVAAYRRAARTLVELEKPIDEIVRNEGLKGVIALPGIGGHRSSDRHHGMLESTRSAVGYARA
ncbi:MAG: helix-hairpin-helix domain-containing protein [Hyphomicrobiaceae bacterium]